MGWVECVRDGLCPEAPPAARGRGQLRDGREGSGRAAPPHRPRCWRRSERGQGVPVHLARLRAGQGRGCIVYLSGLCDAGQSLMVPFPDGHLQGVLPGGASGSGSGMGKWFRQGSPT